MTTRELAAYLRIKERKVYELAGEGRIPCARVTGKLLFPKPLIDLWIAEATGGPRPAAPAPAPPIVAGSHDPLLDWALKQSGSDLAMLSCGSVAGLERLAGGRAVAAALHLLDPESGSYNVAAVRATLGGRDVVVIHWAWRRQGLVVARGNPRGITGLGDLGAEGVRIARRQPGAGSRILFDRLLEAAGLDPATLSPAPETANSELDLALDILDGRADAGLAIEAVARQLGLHFVPLARERYDIAVGRRDYFEPPFQRLLAFARGPALRRRAEEAGGYDVAALGEVVDNGG